MKRFHISFMAAVLAAVLFGGCGKSGEPETPVTPGPDPEPEQPVEKTYAVGDLYSKGFVKGIVASTDEKGEHGLLVSLQETETVWAYRYDDVMSGQPGTGAYNTSLVQKLDGWKEYYPAFANATSANIGALKNWFLPSMNELAALYKAYSGHESNDVEQGTGSTKAEMSESDRKAWFNKCLTDNGGIAISDATYWSSSESGPTIAYAFDMGTGTTVSTPSDLDKEKSHKVRAMASF